MSHDDIVKQALELASATECFITLRNIRPADVKCVTIAEGVEEIVIRKKYGPETNDWSQVTIKFLPF